MKKFKNYHYSLLLAAMVAGLLLCAPIAFAQRAIGAGALILDDGSGHTITIQTPAGGWIGNIPFVIPIPPSGNPPSGFVYTGSSANQILTWVMPNTTGPVPNNYAGGVQGSWQPTTFAAIGAITGTGTANQVAYWNGTSTETGSANFTWDNTNQLLNVGRGYQIGGSTVLANPGAGNLFAGVGAGVSNTTGYDNTFSGYAAGQSNTTGYQNAFAGDYAGYSNTTGINNAFFGTHAGYSNTTGLQNAFSGSYAGYSNTTANYNSFFGNNAGYANTTGNSNAFLGGGAGIGNTTGSSNTFTGDLAGAVNTTGFSNTFTGVLAGQFNTTGDNNTALGYQANVGSAALTNATAIGAGAVVSQSNTIQLGNSSVQAVVVPIGTTAQRPATPVQGMIRFNTTTVKFEGYDGAAWQNLN